MNKRGGRPPARASCTAASTRITRSSTLTRRKVALNASTGEAEMGTGVLNETDASTKKKGAKERKRDADSMEGPRDELDRDHPPRESSAKRAKSAQKNAPFLDPFPSEITPQPATIPEPAMSVADHEAHSRVVASLLASTPPASSSPPNSDGRSPFQLSLSVQARERVGDGELTTPPLNAPSPNLGTFKTPISASSKPNSTRQAITLPPLPSKSQKARPTPRSSVAPSSRSSVAPPSRLFLAANPTNLSNSAASASEPRIPSPPLLEKQSAPAPKASKQIVHLISELTGRVERLERENKVAMQADIKLKARCETLLKENTELTEQVETMDAELGGLRDDMDGQKALVTSILGAIEGLRSGTGAGNVDIAAKKVQKAVDNNAFNTASRKAFLTMCGITNNNQIGTVVPLGLNTYFLHEDGDPDAKLRPDWTSKFIENAGWHAWAVRFLRTKCHQLHGPYTKEDMDRRTDEELTKKLGTIFKRLKALYTSQSKSSPETELAKAKVRRWARRQQRKIKKAENRKDIREESGLVEDHWDFLFEAAYQSSDETDAEDTIDPGTDTSSADEPKVSTAGRDWITKPPTYRSHTVADAVLRLNGLVLERRIEEAKTHKSKHLVHGRKLGDAKEKPLPLPGRAKAIALAMIDPYWLSTHPDSRNACFIDGYTKEEMSEDPGFEGDGEGEADQYQYQYQGGEIQEGSYTMENGSDGDEDLYA